MSGSPVRDLTLQECFAYDPRPRRSGQWLRFRCPRHGGDRQQSLAVNEEAGRFTCHNAQCGIWGTLVEHQPTGWGNPAPPASTGGVTPALAAVTTGRV